MSVAVVVQARLASYRMPAKILAPWGDDTILGTILAEGRRIHADAYFVATDWDSRSTLESTVEQYGWGLVAGDSEDVLSRLLQVPPAYEWLVRICADSPLLSVPLTNYLVGQIDEVSDTIDMVGVPSGLAHGLVRRSALERLASLEPTNEESSHVTPGLRRPGFVQKWVEPPKLTVDTLEEYRALRSLL